MWVLNHSTSLVHMLEFGYQNWSWSISESHISKSKLKIMNYGFALFCWSVIACTGELDLGFKHYPLPFTNRFSDLIFLDHPLTFGLQRQSSGSSWWITQYYHWSGAAVLASTTLQEHAGSDKAWVWHAPDYSDGTLKEELFCIRFGSIESKCGLLSHLIFFLFPTPVSFLFAFWTVENEWSLQLST